MSPRTRAYRIAVAAIKGGAGKTTAAVSIAGALAESGKRTLLVDLDPQEAATYAVGVVEVHHSTYDVLAGNAKAAEAIVATSTEHLHLLPAAPQLVSAELELPGQPGWQTRLAVALTELERDYDAIVIDSPAGRGILPFLSLVAGRNIVVPVTPDAINWRTLPDVMDTIEQAHALDKTVRALGVIPSHVDRASKHQTEILDVLAEDWHVLPAIPKRVAFRDAAAAGQPITAFQPRSPAADAARALTKEIISRAK